MLSRRRVIVHDAILGLGGDGARHAPHRECQSQADCEASDQRSAAESDARADNGEKIRWASSPPGATHPQVPGIPLPVQLVFNARTRSRKLVWQLMQPSTSST